jgi:hypothetical protein
MREAQQMVKYKDVTFASRLHAQWAAFFDLAGWVWDYQPKRERGWRPTFRVEFPCTHSECPRSHILLVEVQPLECISQFRGPCLEYSYGHSDIPDMKGAHTIPADSSAAFGINPHVSWWEMGHGSGGGEETVDEWWANGDVDELWERAERLVERWDRASRK